MFLESADDRDRTTTEQTRNCGGEKLQPSVVSTNAAWTVWANEDIEKIDQRLRCQDVAVGAAVDVGEYT